MSSTANPRAPKADSRIDEATGPVASDSLAAESIQAGGGFSENANAVPLGVRGDQSTLSNTDTSGATALQAASSGAERQKQNFQGLGSDERGSVGVKYPGSEGQPQFTGAVSGDGGYSGGPTAAGGSVSSGTGAAAGKSDFGASTLSTSSGGEKDEHITSSGGQVGNAGSTTTSSTGGNTATSGSAAGVRPFVDVAPTYTGSVTGQFQTEGELRPKGDNLTEGDVPQTKTFTGDVGGPHDPGRLAEQKFANINAGAGADSGLEKEVPAGDDSKGQFGVLSSESA